MGCKLGERWIPVPLPPPVLPRPKFSAGFYRAEIANSHGLRVQTSASMINGGSCSGGPMRHSNLLAQARVQVCQKLTRGSQKFTSPATLHHGLPGVVAAFECIPVWQRHTSRTRQSGKIPDPHDPKRAARGGGAQLSLRALASVPIRQYRCRLNIGVRLWPRAL